MNPSGSFANPHGATNGALSKKGVKLCLESFDEWKIQEIQYNGVERYIQPESFSDHVGKLARQVDWKKVVGSEQTYDNPSLVEEEEEVVEEESEEEKLKRVVTGPAPEAGPWHQVAKHFHDSLQEMNVFLDNLRVMRKTAYMAPLTVLDPNLPEPQPQVASELASNQRSIQWVWKRRALLDAQQVLENAIANRSHNAAEGREKQSFFNELRRMREYWRVRKTGDHIHGDLGYHIFGSKYNPRELFDIMRRPKPVSFNDDFTFYIGGRIDRSLIKSLLQVTVPQDLTCRSTMAVTVVKDDETEKHNLFGSLDDSNFEYMRVDGRKTDNIHWELALKWAQETLICRDTFNGLCTDAVEMRRRMSTVRDGVLLVHIFDDLLLRVELKYHPFTASYLPKHIRLQGKVNQIRSPYYKSYRIRPPISSVTEQTSDRIHEVMRDRWEGQRLEGMLMEEGNPYLNRSLRQMVVAQECTRWLRPQVFVSLPITNLSEQLDVRGPKAFTEKDIDERAHEPTHLLHRLIDVAGHYTMMRMVVDTLGEVMAQIADPQMHWRMLRSSATNSQITVIVSHRGYDWIVGKTTFYIRVGEDSVTVISRDGHLTECGRNSATLVYAIKHVLCTVSVSAVSLLASKLWWFNTLHTNMNNMDEDGNPAPTLYLINHNSTRNILVQFHLEKPAVFKVRDFCGHLSADDPRCVFTVLNTSRLPGSTLMKKADNLFSMCRA